MAETDIPMTMAIRALSAAKAEFEARTYHFVPHGGTQQAAEELGVDHHAVIKTIIMEDDSKKPFVVLMHGDRAISTKQMARILGVKSCQTCEPDTADRHSGYHVGGTSPFGTRKKMRVFAEETIFQLPKIFINGGHRGLFVIIKPDVLDAVLHATHVNVAVDK